MKRPPRIAVRALILQENRLLVVNAYGAGRGPELWCAPGGGIEPGTSLPDNLIREVYEETGLTVRVNAPALINEFHNPDDGFHQVDLFFHCDITAGEVTKNWKDPEGIVSERRFVTQTELSQLPHKPDSLRQVVWSPDTAPRYDALEPIVF